MQIDIEDLGGCDVSFAISDVEILARVQDAIRFRTANPVEFEKQLKESAQIVENNIAYFTSVDLCEGSRWDELQEAIVDMLCKLQAIN